MDANMLSHFELKIRSHKIKTKKINKFMMECTATSVFVVFLGCVAM